GLGQGMLEVRIELGATQRWVRLHAKTIQENIILGLEDISKLKHSQTQLEYLFYFDALTGLPNRSMLVRQLEVMLTSARRRHDVLALAFIDLDRFKLVNDTFGYSAGDDLLSAVGERLKLCLRNTDLLVRMGGDEYAMLLLGDEAYAGKVARRVLEGLSEPFVVGEQELLVSACLGIALYPQDAQDNAQMQAHADLAMFHAKEQGRGRIRFYGSNEHIERKQLERFDLTQMIQTALQRCNVPFEQLELEITESQILTRDPDAERQLRHIAALGVRLSVDDFGTGFSNLARLREIPLHTLKIDRVFVKHLDDPNADGNTEPLVRSIVQLAQNLKLEVIGEGVENQAQLERLHFLGCNIIQGFALGLPMTAEEAQKLL
ncbi:MAG: putative bifunctional diguanylate cyclase/phosphodiesterase, partial [Casimicrobium sp.]